MNTFRVEEEEAMEEEIEGMITQEVASIQIKEIAFQVTIAINLMNSTRLATTAKEILTLIAEMEMISEEVEEGVVIKITEDEVAIRVVEGEADKIITNLITSHQATTMDRITIKEEVLIKEGDSARVETSTKEMGLIRGEAPIKMEVLATEEDLAIGAASIHGGNTIAEHLSIVVIEITLLTLIEDQTMLFKIRGDKAILSIRIVVEGITQEEEEVILMVQGTLTIIQNIKAPRLQDKIGKSHPTIKTGINPGSMTEAEEEEVHTIEETLTETQVHQTLSAAAVSNRPEAEDQVFREAIVVIIRTR